MFAACVYAVPKAQYVVLSDGYSAGDYAISWSLLTTFLTYVGLSMIVCPVSYIELRLHIAECVFSMHD